MEDLRTRNEPILVSISISQTEAGISSVLGVAHT